MKHKIFLAISVIALLILAAGCASNTAEAVVAEPAATAEPVTIGFIPTPSPIATPTPVATPTPTPTPTPTATPVSTPSAANGTLELTLDQLKQYDGKNGNPAYIAVDGVIYDVTNDKHWKTGSHEGYSAGKDLTDAIMGKSPHGTSVLEGVPIVGKLIG